MVKSRKKHDYRRELYEDLELANLGDLAPTEKHDQRKLRHEEKEERNRTYGPVFEMGPEELGINEPRRKNSPANALPKRGHIRKLYPEAGKILSQKEIDMQGYTPDTMRHNTSYRDIAMAYGLPTRKKPESAEYETREQIRKKWEKKHKADTITGTIPQSKKRLIPKKKKSQF